MPSYQILQILQTKQAGFIPTRDFIYLKGCLYVTKKYFLLSLWWKKKIKSPAYSLPLDFLEIMFGSQDEKIGDCNQKAAGSDYSPLFRTYTTVCGD